MGEGGRTRGCLEGGWVPWRGGRGRDASIGESCLERGEREGVGGLPEGETEVVA